MIYVGHIKKFLVMAVIVIAVAGCSKSIPSRPAMQPLAVAGSFGFSDRAVDSDTIEITYYGSEVGLSSFNTRNAAQIQSERNKVSDLAMLRAAHIAKERGLPAFRVISEKTESNVEVQSYPRCRPAPFWGYSGYGFSRNRHFHGFGGWPYSHPYSCSERKSVTGQAVTVLTVDLISTPTKGDKFMKTEETISRLEKIYSGAAY